MKFQNETNSVGIMIKAMAMAMLNNGKYTWLMMMISKEEKWLAPNMAKNGQ